MRSITVFVFLIAAISCEYSSDEKNYVNVPRPEMPSVLNVVLSDPSDTLLLWGEAQIDYQVYFGNIRFHSIRIYIDSVYVTGTTSTSSIIVNTESINDGYHTMEIQLLANTGSGSLADHSGNEFFVKKEQRVIRVDNGEPTQPLAIQSMPANGTLQLTWDQYSRGNFESYKVYKQFINSSGQLDEKLIKTIYDSKITTVCDSSYLGGFAEYRIVLNALGRNYYGGRTRIDDALFSSLKVTIRPDRLAEISWNRCNFQANFASYKIYSDGSRAYYTPPWWLLLGQITDINDTVFVDSSFGFGEELHYYLVVNSSQVPGDSLVKTSAPVSLGTYIHRFLRIKFVQPLNSIYITSDSSSRIDATTLQVTGMNGGMMDVSNDGSRAFMVDHGKLYQLDPMSMTKIRQVNIDTLFNYHLPPYDVHRTSNVFMSTPADILYTDNYESVNNYSSYQRPATPIDVSDLDAPRLLSIAISTGEYAISSISNNGLFLTMSGGSYSMVYQRDNENYLRKYAVQASNFCWDNSGDNHITTEDHKIIMKQNTDNTVIKEISVEHNLFNLSVDPVTGYLGARLHPSESPFPKYFIYDLEDGSLKAEINLATNLMNSIFLVNNMLWSTAGYYINIP